MVNFSTGSLFRYTQSEHGHRNDVTSNDKTCDPRIQAQLYHRAKNDPIILKKKSRTRIALSPNAAKSSPVKDALFFRTEVDSLEQKACICDDLGLS